MKHTYTVTGMTCNGCKNSVQESLIALENVVNAEVNLEKAEATIKMSKHIPIETLQSALSDKYKIKEKKI